MGYLQTHLTRRITGEVSGSRISHQSHFPKLGKARRRMTFCAEGLCVAGGTLRFECPNTRQLLVLFLEVAHQMVGWNQVRERRVAGRTRICRLHIIVTAVTCGHRGHVGRPCVFHILKSLVACRALYGSDARRCCAWANTMSRVGAGNALMFSGSTWQ